MTYLFVAYAVTWVMILGYVASLARRRRQALRQAESLTQTLERRQQSQD